LVWKLLRTYGEGNSLLQHGAAKVKQAAMNRAGLSADTQS
jgi:hypothetical protein